MKLLLDENLSRRLVPFLQEDYPGSSQVALEGLESATDREIWQFAKEGGYVIVTRDADFEELSLALGQPPKVIWLKEGNPSRATTLQVLTRHHGVINHALVHEDQACLEIGLGPRTAI